MAEYVLGVHCSLCKLYNHIHQLLAEVVVYLNLSRSSYSILTTYLDLYPYSYCCFVADRQKILATLSMAKLQ